MLTTLNAIRSHNPCTEIWKKLLTYLGKTKADDEPLSILTILDSNGLDDALWCLRAVEGHDRQIRLYAVWCARQVQHLMADSRSVAAIDVADRYANGAATRDELVAAWEAACDSAWAAAWAAGDARAARVARVAWVVARDAEAACDSAWAAEFARDAAWAARVAWAAWAARDVARAAWDAQERRLREICMQEVSA